jgi:hypothetical protein
MKKVPSRSFQKEFGQISNKLKPGEIVQVTKHGKTLGQFIKGPVRQQTMPDFWENLKDANYPIELGDILVKEFDESLS